MQILVSIAILGAALFIILSDKFNAQNQHWAFGAAGTIVGYWLKT